MELNIIDVSQPNTSTTKNGRQYQTIEVTYKGNDGKVANKKLMSFSNPEVFKQAQTWEKGDVINVATEKDDAGYWQWIRVLAEGEEAPAPTNRSAGDSVPKANTTTRVTGSNYETKEERALRQLMIVRQSSLANAVATLTTHQSPLNYDQVIALATKYESFVMGKQQAESFDQLTDDVPY